MERAGRSGAGSDRHGMAQRLAALSGAGAALLGAAGLAGWAFDLERLTRVVPGYKAIAPSVAVSLIVLGIILQRLATAEASRRERGVSAALAGAVTLFGLLEVIGFFADSDLNLEEAMTGHIARASSIPFETMSPVAGVLLFLNGAALLALLLDSGRTESRQGLGDAAGALSLLAGTVALIFALGYAYGAPLLYGGPAIPIALTASLGGLLLGLGTVGAAGWDDWPLRLLSGNSARARLLRSFVPLTVTLTLIITIVDHRLADVEGFGHVLMASVLAVAFALISGLVVSRVAHTIGETIDQAQLARRRAEQALARQVNLLEAIAENTDAHLVYLDRDFNFIWVNTAYAEACRRSRDEFIGHNHFEFYPHEENEAIFRRVRDTGEPARFIEKPFVFPDMPERGVTYWDWTLTPLKDEAGVVQNLVFALADATEKVRTREQIATAERGRAELLTTLNRELGHRVKNNLALVAGLLQMQIASSGDPQLAASLREAISRLYTFAHVHEQLGLTGSDEVSLLSAIRGCAASIQGLGGAGAVDVSVEGDEARYPSRAASNLCLVANELLTNAVKHGAPGSAGRLRVTARLARDNGRLRLSVWNSGAPVARDFDPSKRTTLGLTLVQSLVVSQYHGAFSLRPQGEGNLAEATISEEALAES
ncbi:MAG: sensor histidine kinase [Armatimonadota bacterium]